MDPKVFNLITVLCAVGILVGTAFVPGDMSLVREAAAVMLGWAGLRRYGDKS